MNTTLRELPAFLPFAATEQYRTLPVAEHDPDIRPVSILINIIHPARSFISGT
jgi:hypothetical protein